MGLLQFAFITMPGIQVQEGVFDPASALSGPALGISALLTYAILAAAIAWVERRRMPKVNLQT